MNRVQYISQGETNKEQLRHITEVLDAGCGWIQLRHKNGGEDERRRLAEQVRQLCSGYGATFIVNDHPELAFETGADGVHLGLSDVAVGTARMRLGTGKIIGGTANTLEDVLQRVAEGCDYIGLGPFAYTTTKAKLSPILGLEGYQRMLKALGSAGTVIPIYAIGGITLADLPALAASGIAGVAVSGLLSRSKDKRQTINIINELLTCQY
ncbi:thiamine phosphate synthase [Pedobacter yulinensis]|uniref:Thiamine-phosphate synthase n=1 Tax=Pedobacter yulinensis TaxID=2126353 RepID=A0A2T3HKS3_9SPHI|nr:thiamine phosphate synthase [Pedobacter yulinensis]PST83055.1 thiamine phosphate synthase [Pedobacter yulinensis]